MINLRFEVTNTGPFPYVGNNLTIGLTVCALDGDPALVYIGQTTFEDPIHYLTLAIDSEYKNHNSPPGWSVITGLAWNPLSQTIWCSNGTNTINQVVAFDPLTELETNSLTLTPTAPIWDSSGIGTNGFLFTRAVGAKLELRNMNGFLLGEKDYPGRYITGLSASPASWTFGDKNADEICIIGPFGNIFATAPAPGPANGMHAIAFDYVTNHAAMPKVIPPSDGSAPGDPTVPWTPEPWGGRHRLYVANVSDNTIYAGYLTEA